MLCNSVRTGHGKPGETWNFEISFSRQVMESHLKLCLWRKITKKAFSQGMKKEEDGQLKKKKKRKGIKKQIFAQ